ncbi:hypothetical protein [Kribbella sp. CA-247076]|uniref:hypothetical protein n=1 Tax=Kribbella sp. CA-247076 TaxID=3239941 RepID=UPI003D8D7BD0
MVSDLQRVARGLVDCLDEVPQVVQHLQRTADRCRENAQVALMASHGRATVAAQQLDAAARACEAAAHYLSLAPPKARAWAERLVGSPRTTDRPSSDSADRNKATGGTGDVAERDLRGRTKRLTARYDDVDLPEDDDDEPPLITVARKAFEKFRKDHEKDEEPRDDPIELEITVTETGDLVIEEESDKDLKAREHHEHQATADHAIEVDLTDQLQRLLAAMSDSTDAPWDHAHLTITPTHIEATFNYPDEAPTPITVDINLPPLPPAAVLKRNSREAPTAFDPAFDNRPLGPDFTPGVHDPLDSFVPKERAIADRLAEEGWRVDALIADHTEDGLKNPDVMVRKSRHGEGVVVEFKTPESGTSNAVKRLMHEASEQADEIVIDGRPPGVSEEVAWRSFRRACGQPGKPLAAVVHVILGDGRFVTYKKEQ